MNSILRNVLSCLIGVVLGGGINMAIVVIGPSMIPPPPGVDVTSPEGLSASIHLLEPKHFVTPFLAHALGTLAGSLSAFLIAASHKSAFSYLIGTVFLAGGIAATFMIAAPMWFIILDLVGAYIPMSWIAVKLGTRISKGTIVASASRSDA